jgi:hypothetical protein
MNVAEEVRGLAADLGLDAHVQADPGGALVTASSGADLAAVALAGRAVEVQLPAPRVCATAAELDAHRDAVMRLTSWSFAAQRLARRLFVICS